MKFLFKPVQSFEDITRNFEQLEGLLLGRIQTVRVTTGSVAAAGRALVTCTWPQAFPDASYTAVPSVTFTKGGATAALRVERVESKAADKVVVCVINDDGAAAHTGTVECAAIHD